MSSCDPVSTRSNSLTANFLLRFLWPMHMLTEKHPKQYGPRKRLREKTLAGAVTVSGILKLHSGGQGEMVD
jgi:hypothetical protein